jgi:hypothetical protein
MKNLKLFFIFFMALNANASEIFDGYESFYQSLPHRLFKEKAKPIAAEDSIVWIAERKINLMKATAFPDEPIFMDDIGTHPTLYASKGYFCVEGRGATSGTASRHIAVYLIDRKNKRQFKLPSLFASCLSIGKSADGNPTFFAAKIINYRAAYDADGVHFQEYMIDKNLFKKTENEINIEFISNDDFYHFSVKP